MTIDTIFIDKDGIVKANPGMEYPKDNTEPLVCEADCEGECGDVCPNIQGARWRNEEKEINRKAYHSGLLPFEDQGPLEFILQHNDPNGEWNPITIRPDTIVHISPIEVEVIKICKQACMSPCDDLVDRGECVGQESFIRIKN